MSNHIMHRKITNLSRTTVLLVNDVILFFRCGTTLTRALQLVSSVSSSTPVSTVSYISSVAQCSRNNFFKYLKVEDLGHTLDLICEAINFESYCSQLLFVKYFFFM